MYKYLLLSALVITSAAHAQTRGGYMAAAAQAQQQAATKGQAQSAQQAKPAQATPAAQQAAQPAAAQAATATPAAAPAAPATAAEWCKGAKGAEAEACARLAATYTAAEIEAAAQKFAVDRAKKQSWLYGGVDAVDHHFGLGAYLASKYDTRGACDGGCPDSGAPATGPWRQPILTDFGVRLWWHPLSVMEMRWITFWGQVGARAGYGATGKDAQWSAHWSAGVQFSIGRVGLYGGFAGTHTNWSVAKVGGGGVTTSGVSEFGKGAVFGASLTLGRARVFAECDVASRPGHDADGTEWSTVATPCGAGLGALIW